MAMGLVLVATSTNGDKTMSDLVRVTRGVGLLIVCNDGAGGGGRVSGGIGVISGTSSSLGA